MESKDGGQASKCSIPIIICRYNNLENYYVQSNSSYFTLDYTSSKTTCPCECCGKKFWSDFKLGVTNAVYLCEIAKKESHTCNHGLCKLCYLKKMADKNDVMATTAEKHHIIIIIGMIEQHEALIRWRKAIFLGCKPHGVCGLGSTAQWHQK